MNLPEARAGEDPTITSFVVVFVHAAEMATGTEDMNTLELVTACAARATGRLRLLLALLQRK